MFNGFPCDKKPDHIEAISLDPGKMFVCILQWKRPSHKTDIAAIQKALFDMRRDVWIGWLLLICADIQTSQCKDAVRGKGSVTTVSAIREGNNTVPCCP